MSATVRPCPVCGSGNRPDVRACWICRSPLPAAPAPAPTGAGSAPRPAVHRGPRLVSVGWALVVAGLTFVGVLVGVELALEAPGLLVPYGIFILVVFAGMFATVFAQSRTGPTAPATPGAPAGPPPGGEAAARAAATVATGFVLGIGYVAMAIAIIYLLAFVALVLFAIVCFAVLFGAGAMN